jgi:hypothetical protein
MATNRSLRLDEAQVTQIIANLQDFLRDCNINEPTELFMGLIKECLTIGRGFLKAPLDHNQFGATLLYLLVNPSSLSMGVLDRHEQPLPLLTARLKYYLEAGMLRERLDITARYLVGKHESNRGRFVKLVSEDRTLPNSKAQDAKDELMITVLPLWNGRKMNGQRRSHWTEITVLEDREEIAFLFIQAAQQSRR